MQIVTVRVVGAQLQFNIGEVCGGLCTSAADKVLNPSICKDTPLSSGLLITAILGDVSPFVKLYFAALDSASERKRKENPFVGNKGGNRVHFSAVATQPTLEGA